MRRFVNAGMGAASNAFSGGREMEPTRGETSAADLRDRLAERFRKRLIAAAADSGGVPTTDSVELAARHLVDREAAVLGARQRAAIVERLVSDTLGLGPVDALMRDPEVDEIMVNGPECVYVERRGRIVQTDVAFDSDGALMNVVERILAGVGRRIDESSPLVDARLPDGSRVNCVIPPLSLTGILLTIRKFRTQGFTSDDLVANGTIGADVGALLGALVRGRANVVVSGGTGSGKTTTLNALSGFISADERIVTIEDAAELRLQQPHVLRLESRPANVEGTGSISIRALVRNALRMRPDRIVVGEVRGGEALDMLQAMNTGHEGSLTTIHANAPVDAVRRIETLAMMADVDLPHRAVQQQVAGAIDVVVHQERKRTGGRCVVSVAEVVDSGSGCPSVKEIFAGGELRLDRIGGRLGAKIETGGFGGSP